MIAYSVSWFSAYPSLLLVATSEMLFIAQYFKLISNQFSEAISLIISMSVTPVNEFFSFLSLS
jgi:hypothetical protein